MNLSEVTNMKKIKAAQVSGRSTIYSDAVDLMGMSGVLIFTTIVTKSGNANFIKAQQCPDAAFEAGVMDIDGLKIVPSASGDMCWVDVKNPSVRYIRLAIVRAGADFATGEIYAITYSGLKTPEVNVGTGIIGALVVGASAVEPVGLIQTPSIVSPAAGEEDTELDMTITSSDYAASDSEAAHEKSQFQLTAAGDTAFASPIIDAEVTEGTLTEYALAGTELETEVGYLIRVRYYSEALGWSEWSPTRSFNTLSVPTITELDVVSGSNDGATAVTITGTEFVTGAVVLFDDQEADNVVVVSATQITCVTPAHANGAVSVTVTNTDGGTITEETAFTYFSSPTVVTLNVTSGSNEGSTAVTITGTEFADGAVVKFGADDATDVVVVGPTSITCVTPAHVNGAVSVTVTNTDTGVGVKATAFTYFSSPTVATLDVVTGAIAGGTAVTITGTEFAAGAVVKFDTTDATDVVVVSATSITCVSPAHAAGAVTVSVTNTDTGTASKLTAFTYTE